MKRDDLGKPMFTRTYHHGDGRELIVKIWKPSRSTGPLFCWFQIGDGSVHRTLALDPLDGVFHAMQTIEMLLRRMRDKTDPGLHWKATIYEGDLGLPACYPRIEDKQE